MVIRLIRHTGFYGMGSPLTVRVNGQSAFSIGHEKEKVIQTDGEDIEIQITFFWLKSPTYKINDTEKERTYEIIMNPKLVWTYIPLFMISVLFPVLFRYWIGGVLFLIVYFLFLLRMVKQAYLLKEVTNGTER